MGNDANIYIDDNIRVFKYKQSLLSTYIPGIDNMYFNRKVRYLLTYLCGGSIYYMVDRENEDIMGYCMISKGKSLHYRYAEPDSITVGPIFLKRNYRGKRLSVFLLETVLRHCSNQGHAKAYMYAHRSNQQSNALILTVGFEPVGNLKIANWTRSVSITEQQEADYRLYSLKL